MTTTHKIVKNVIKNVNLSEKTSVTSAKKLTKC